VCERILEEYEVERETLENDLRQFLSELADNELVVRT
jgi:hypothetical protein